MYNLWLNSFYLKCRLFILKNCGHILASKLKIITNGQLFVFLSLFCGQFVLVFNHIPINEHAVCPPYNPRFDPPLDWLLMWPLGATNMHT